jgi:hypothetical protein
MYIKMILPEKGCIMSLRVDQVEEGKHRLKYLGDRTI